MGILVAMVIGAIYYVPKWVDKILENYPSESHTKQETIEGFETDYIINGMLQDMLTDYKADRAKLVQFHNGVQSFGGVPFRFLAVSHEKVGTGVSSEMIEYQNIPTSIMGDYVQLLLRGETVVMTDVSEVKDNALKQLLINQGTKAKCAQPIFTTGNQLVGYISIDYVNRGIPEGVSCQTLSREAKVLENILFNEE